MRRNTSVKDASKVEGEAIKQFESFGEVIDKAVECFEKADSILFEGNQFPDFRCIMALISLELLMVKDILHGENLVRSKSDQIAVRNEKFVSLIGRYLMCFLKTSQ